MSTPSVTTESLLAQAVDDIESRGVLLERWSNYLRLLARTQFNRQIQARVSDSDVVQDTMLEAHRDFANFRGQSTAEFLAWLRQVLLHNVARVVDRHLGAGKRDVRREQSLDQLARTLEGSAERFANLLADRGSSPSVKAIQQEELLALANAMVELPEDYYEVIADRHLEGLSFREIAQRMNRSEGAVRMLWFRAMDRLRVSLSEKGVL